MHGKRAWTKREIEQLVAMTLDGVGPHELGRRLHRASATIRAMQVELELIEARELRRRWTAEEMQIVREKYPNTVTEELGRQLGKAVYSVYNMAKKLGVSKSAEYLASANACRLRRGDNIGAAFRYPKGHVPANKGARRPGFAPGRMSETQFKPGTSTNKMPLGATRLIDGYVYRKTSEIPNVPHTRNWRLEHYLIWEAVHGPVPDGHALVFKDGDRLHVELNNLELITRAELARRNSIHNLPEDLKEVIRLNASVKRRIRRISEEQNVGPAQPSV